MELETAQLKNAIKTLKKAVDYARNNLDKSSFDKDKDYWQEKGYVNGLWSALYLLQQLDEGADEKTALRMAVDMEEE